jgi:hypothetical protein
MSNSWASSHRNTNLKKLILYEQFCIFSPTYFQVYRLVSHPKPYFFTPVHATFTLHLTFLCLIFLYEFWGKRTNRYVTSSLSRFQTHNYIPTVRLSYWLVRCYTQSSQNQGMQWFTELLRHVGRVVTFRRLWVKFLSSGLWPRTKHIVEFPEQHHKHLFTLQRAVGSVTNTTLPRFCTVYSATASCRRWRWKRGVCLTAGWLANKKSFMCS